MADKLFRLDPVETKIQAPLEDAVSQRPPDLSLVTTQQLRGLQGLSKGLGSLATFKRAKDPKPLDKPCKPLNC